MQTGDSDFGKTALRDLSPELHRLGILAERFFADDANTSLIKSRQFAEYLVKEIDSSDDTGDIFQDSLGCAGNVRPSVLDRFPVNDGDKIAHDELRVLLRTPNPKLSCPIRRRDIANLNPLATSRE